MNRFATFGVLYMTAILLELAERWRHPAAAPVALALALAVVWTGVTRAGFAVFLLATSGYIAFVLFPDVANHVNLALYCNVLILTGIGYTLLRRREFADDAAAFELLRPVLQVSMVLVYVLAGFAKLNTDFLSPAVSCVGSMAAELARLRGSSFAGLPTPLLFVGGLVLAGDRLLASGGGWRARAGLAALAVLVAVALVSGPTGPATVPAAVVLGMAGLVLLWEIVGGALLVVPALQAPVLAFSWSMHATLALIGFVDFGALALALLFAFLPSAWFERMNRPVALPAGGLAIPRPLVYGALCLAAGVCSAAGRRLPAGVLFNLAALALLWPVLAAVLARPRALSWTGVPLRSAGPPGWMFVFPLLLLLHGLTSYAGLRTAGNFTMFSNLRTEGPRSNHLLLGSNPLKVWGYQEDAVRFIRIDDRRAAVGYQYQPLEGNHLPVVEFRKLIHRWQRAGMTVPMTIEYDGRVHATEDIARDPVWGTGHRDWAMRLMDFRVIQPEGANRCRW